MQLTDPIGKPLIKPFLLWHPKLLPLIYDQTTIEYAEIMGELQLYWETQDQPQYRKERDQFLTELLELLSKRNSSILTVEELDELLLCPILKDNSNDMV